MLKKILIMLLSGYPFINANEPKKNIYLNNEQKADFISRWNFQDLCKFTFDPHHKIYNYPTSDNKKATTFNPSLVQPGDIIFVRSIDKFFKQINPKITNPYIIISHGNHLDAFRENYLDYLNDDKIIHWFGIHTNIKHKKFTLLPLGINQSKNLYEDKELLAQYINNLRENKKEKKLLLLNFFCESGKVLLAERCDLINKFKGKSYATINNSNLKFTDYLQQMSNHKFTISPFGWADDSYRTWEALLTGSVPIVKSSSLNSLYEDLPVLIVNSWQELNEKNLNKKYRKIISKKYNLDKLYMAYWKDLIFKTQEQFLNNFNKTK